MSKRTTLECNGYVDINYIPDFSLFELDYNKMFNK